MDCALYRKFTAMLMVMVIVTMTVASFCRSAHASEPPGDAPYGHCAGSLGAVDGECPDCPGDEHSLPDHCDSCCHCPCHAPLAPDQVSAGFFPQIALIIFREPFTALPEVYLPKFIPPHILA